jgi:hypothetical protein
MEVDRPASPSSPPEPPPQRPRRPAWQVALVSAAAVLVVFTAVPAAFGLVHLGRAFRESCGACAQPAERSGTAGVATAPSSTSNRSISSQDIAALERTQLEIDRFCKAEFPDHCAGVVLIMGQRITDISVLPAARKLSPQELAAFREQLERLTGKKMSQEEFAALVKQLEQPGGKELSPEQLAALKGLGMQGLDQIGGNQLVVYRRPLRALDAAVRQRFPQVGATLRFADARYSFKYLDALGRRIIADQFDMGIRISEVSPEPDGSGIRVVTPDVRRARQLLQQRYGPAVIVAYQGDCK